MTTDEEIRQLGEELGIIHDDASFEEMLSFIKGLIANRLKKGA